MAEKKKASPAKKTAAKKVVAKKKAPAKKKVAETQEVLPVKEKSLVAKVVEDKDNILMSLKRTLIPIGVGAVSASFIGPYIDQATVRDFLAGLIAAVYYTAVRFLEVQNPKIGVLLGAPNPPKYKK